MAVNEAALPMDVNERERRDGQQAGQGAHDQSSGTTDSPPGRKVTVGVPPDGLRPSPPPAALLQINVALRNDKC